MIDGASSKVIRDADAGLTCPAENLQGLAENVVKMKEMRASGVLDVMGRNAREYYNKNFERSFLLNKAEILFNSMIKKS